MLPLEEPVPEDDDPDELEEVLVLVPLDPEVPDDVVPLLVPFIVEVPVVEPLPGLPVDEPLAPVSVPFVELLGSG